MQSTTVNGNHSAGFDNTYIRLQEKFFHHCNPDKVPQPRLICFNNELADHLNLRLQGLSDMDLAGYFSGNMLFADSEPIAMAYAGHQFGSFVPQLGDGRAILLGEIVTLKGKRYDIQLKGSGRTRWSRGGDGKSALGPVIREYIVSEAMHALGVPTTRALAMVTTGEEVLRQTGKLPGGILTRVASGYMRIGTFEYFLARNDLEAIGQLADYAIRRHYPEAARDENPYISFFKQVCDRQAALVAKWMQLGFIHGVMNTDNTSICGETIDYGPCAFMDEYDHNTVFSSIDIHGRYRYGNQGGIILWNLSSLAHCLFHLFDEDEDTSRSLYTPILEHTQVQFLHNWQQGMLKKVGLNKVEEKDIELVENYLDILREQNVDYTLAFRYLADNINRNTLSGRYSALFKRPEELDNWMLQWKKRLLRESASGANIVSLMNRTNPAYIPRNHRVEKAIQQAEKENRFEEIQRFMDVLKNPFSEQPDTAEYMLPPTTEERVLQTFCGT
ncbi:protein adenylyltransferase SelO [Desulfogranum japonicum]|uniref:protein adenylyltransferase SelO n=1 Tax=Desulfogranum japonicum TaxID=231447 RepID=UPI0003FE3916|nr:YdiU family protein [Desulfogranum japonicum]